MMIFNHDHTRIFMMFYVSVKTSGVDLCSRWNVFWYLVQHTAFLPRLLCRPDARHLFWSKNKLQKLEAAKAAWSLTGSHSQMNAETLEIETAVYIANSVNTLGIGESSAMHQFHEPQHSPAQESWRWWRETSSFRAPSNHQWPGVTTHH